MEKDIHTIVERQLNNASNEFDRVERSVKRIQVLLNKKTFQLKKACERLMDIEEIHANLP